MLKGLMQDHPLTIQHILDRMRRVYGDSEVVTLKSAEGEKTRATYAEVGERVDRLCNALESLGIKPGDRVATFAWNTQEHLEVYMGVPCMGAVLHTLNIRLFPEQLTYIANHAEDKIVFVSDSVVPLLEKVAPTFETVEQYVVIGDGDSGSLPNVIRYEELLAEQQGDGYDYPSLDENAGCRPLLHERHHRQPEGRAVLASLERPAHDGLVHERDARMLIPGPRPSRRADVPRQRLGPAVRLRDGRGRHRDARPVPPGRAAGQPDRAGKDHLRRCRADDLDGPAAVRGREQARPLQPQPRRLRRRRCARVAHARLRGAPQRKDHSGVGDDRDEPAGRRRLAAQVGRGRGRVALPDGDRPDHAAASRSGSSTTRARASLGRRDDRAR